MPTPPTLDRVFVFSGQSNISGRAPISGAPAHGDLSRAWLLKPDGNWQNPPTDPANDPTDATYSVLADTGATVGPILYFAERWIRFHPTQTIGLVPAAKGGLAMSEFARDLATTTVYGAMIARITAAAAYGPISGVAHYQGEKNADSTVLRDAWLSGFTQFVPNVRSDTGVSNLKFVLAIIGPFSAEREVTSPYGNDIRTIQSRVNIPGVATVHNSGATLYDDVHLDAVSAKSWGYRAADAMRLLGA